MSDTLKCFSCLSTGIDELEEICPSCGSDDIDHEDDGADDEWEDDEDWDDEWEDDDDWDEDEEE